MYRLYLSWILIVFILNSAQAFGLESITTSLFITKENAVVPNNLSGKKIYLMNIQLTPQQKKKILTYNPIEELPTTFNASFPTRIILNMHAMPVLDQGKHGSCVTFSNTAAIDTILGKGDYISQLCSLELSSFLSDKSIHSQSGWNGTALSPIILNQLSSFGIISKEKQKIKSCGNLFEYPINNPSEEGQPMSLDEYKDIREIEDINVEWQSLLTLSQRLDINPSDPSPYNGNKILRNIKHFLALSASRSSQTPLGIITFGSFLPIDYCHGGACAQYHKQYDTWVITPDIDKLDPIHATLPGHEMIIFGYDDNAIAIDNEGNQYKGLLFLRSSWGDDVGDQGNFYMSYDFFKKFVIEIQLIYQPALQTKNLN